MTLNELTLDETPRPSIPILYGTETGNAQDLAELLAKRLKRLRFGAKVYGMDEYDLSNLPCEPVILFICSTTGQGELPRNTKRFWRFLLRRKLPPTLLSSVKFTTFGLGDTSYPRYNWAVRKLHTRLMNLGAKDFADRGEGDEQSPDGVDKVYQEWENGVCEKLEILYPLPQGVEPIPLETLLPPTFSVVFDKEKEPKEPKESKEPEEPKMPTENQAAAVGMSRCLISNGQTMELHAGRVLTNSRVTSKDHFQDVRNLVFESVNESEKIKYDPGDTVALYPYNSAKDVQDLLDHQGWSDLADYSVSVSDEFSQCVFGGLVEPLTIRSLLTHHLDIMAIPRRSFFANVWYFAKDSEREQERLLEFSTLEGLEDLYDYANRPRRSILETITEFDHLRIPIDYILDVFPVLRPRLFSIASPQDDQHIQLAVAIVKYKTIIRRIRRGVCTRYIENLSTGDPIPFSIHRNGLYHAKSFLSNTKTKGGNPLILIATGTGIAPVISIAKTLLSANDNDTGNDDSGDGDSSNNNNRRTQPIYLFFGCRGYEKDFHFKQDWSDLVTKYGPDLLKIHVAFSQDKSTPTDTTTFPLTAMSGVHVQALMYAHKDVLGPLMKNNDNDNDKNNKLNPESVIYLCGSSGKMPREVRLTLQTILKETVQGWSDFEAEEYILGMEQSGRYIQETW